MAVAIVKEKDMTLMSDPPIEIRPQVEQALDSFDLSKGDHFMIRILSNERRGDDFVYYIALVYVLEANYFGYHHYENIVFTGLAR
jgi:hypothetical protein